MGAMNTYICYQEEPSTQHFYPRELCIQICRVLRSKKIFEEDEMEHLHSQSCVKSRDAGPCRQQPNAAQGVNNFDEDPALLPQSEGFEFSPMATDDVKGGALGPGLVKQARKGELGYVKKMRVYSKVSREEPRRKNKPIIGIRWIDANKGSGSKINMRSRLVAQDFKRVSGRRF